MSKEVQLLSSAETNFPEVCPVCSAQEPSETRDFVVYRRPEIKEFNARRETLKCVYSVPVCPSCVPALVWSARLRKIAVAGGVIVGLSLAKAALDWSPEDLRSMTWAFGGLLVALVVMPVLVAWMSYQPHFSVSLSRWHTAFQFRESSLADRFELLNLGAKG